MPSRAAIEPHAMIETIVAAMAGTVSADGATMPLPTVAATAVPAMAPTVFITTAMTMACRAVITPVETTVAIALGASVQPLTNSATSTANRANARPIVSASTSCLLAGERKDLAGAVIGVVGHLLEEVEQLVPGNEPEHVLAGAGELVDELSLVAGNEAGPPCLRARR